MHDARLLQTLQRNQCGVPPPQLGDATSVQRDTSARIPFDVTLYDGATECLARQIAARTLQVSHA